MAQNNTGSNSVTTSAAATTTTCTDCAEERGQPGAIQFGKGVSLLSRQNISPQLQHLIQQNIQQLTATPTPASLQGRHIFVAAIKPNLTHVSSKGQQVKAVPLFSNIPAQQEFEKRQKEQVTVGPKPSQLPVQKTAQGLKRSGDKPTHSIKRVKLNSEGNIQILRPEGQLYQVWAKQLTICGLRITGKQLWNISCGSVDDIVKNTSLTQRFSEKKRWQPILRLLIRAITKRQQLPKNFNPFLYKDAKIPPAHDKLLEQAKLEKDPTLRLKKIVFCHQQSLRSKYHFSLSTEQLTGILNPARTVNILIELFGNKPGASRDFDVRHGFKASNYFYVTAYNIRQQWLESLEKYPDLDYSAILSDITKHTGEPGSSLSVSPSNSHEREIAFPSPRGGGKDISMVEVEEMPCQEQTISEAPVEKPLESMFPVLSDPHTNLCYIKCAIFFLKLFLSPKELQDIKETTDLEMQEDENVLQCLLSFSRLLSAMEMTHSRHSNLEQNWKDFIISCFQCTDIFRTSMQLIPSRRKKNPGSPKTFTLKTLDHNDTNSFLSDLEQLLHRQIEGRPHLKLCSMMTTSHNNQTYSRISASEEMTLQLSLRVRSDGCIQTAITDYLASESLENVHWQSYQSLPEGKYPTKRNRLIIPEQGIQHFRIFLGECWMTEHHGAVIPLGNAIDHIFNPVSLPATSPDHRSITHMKADPVCIIARSGINSHAGHYEMLVNHQGNWFLVDCSPVRELEDPKQHLRSRALYPHTIGYRVKPA